MRTGTEISQDEATFTETIRANLRQVYRDSTNYKDIQSYKCIKKLKLFHEYDRDEPANLFKKHKKPFYFSEDEPELVSDFF